MTKKRYQMKEALRTQLFSIEFEIRLEEAELASLQRKYEVFGDTHMAIMKSDDAFAEWAKASTKTDGIVLRQRVMSHAIIRHIRMIEFLKKEAAELRERLGVSNGR